MLVAIKPLEQKRAWMMGWVIVSVVIGFPLSITGASDTLAKNAQSEAVSISLQQNGQFKSVDVQVPADINPVQAAQAISPETLTAPNQPLSSFYFYIDPGHNAAGGPPDPTGTCADRGTSYNGLYEGDITWQIADKLRAILEANGVPQSRVFMSRPSSTTYVTVRYRVTPPPPNTPCSTYSNNQAFLDHGSPTNKWRFISIHLNSGGGGTERVEVFRKVRGWGFPTIPLADEFAENMSWQLNRPYPHPNAPYSGNWTNAYDPSPSFCNGEPLPCDLYVVRFSLPRAFEDTRPECRVNQWCHHGSYNILAELGYLDNASFNGWIAQSSNQQAEAQALYRGLTDFMVAGRPGEMQNKNTAIFEDYRQNILAGRDPGVPFDNGGGYYVHQYASAPALTQEFNSATNVKGSILTPIGGGAAYYVPDPIWSTYLQKNGPYSNGPGLPLGEVHSWTATRRSCPGCQSYFYDKVLNFERGAILWNSYEGGITPADKLTPAVVNKYLELKARGRL
ncbi:MAG: N-acetylmuramoyl-L-alanine amidase [Chloroflexi bacterium]|nr:N-acetylmuramoyl-L-alanine amidase [Chloroflexota bacterium]